jgi:alpha-ribazole phosphatase
MRLHLVRHPRPDVAAGICYGSTDLTASFDTALLTDLKTKLPAQTPLFSSPLKRCAALAEALAPMLDSAVPIHDARLAEMDFGAWEMQAWDDIPREQIDAWSADLTAYRPGQGENLLEVAQRVLAFRDEVLKRDASDAVVICHAGTMRLLSAAQQGGAPADIALRAAQSPHQIAYGEVMVLSLLET